MNGKYTLKGTNEKPHILNRFITVIIDFCIIALTLFLTYNIFLSTSMADNMKEAYVEMTVIRDSYIYNIGLGDKNYNFDVETNEKKVYEDKNGEYVIDINYPSSNATDEEKEEFNALLKELDKKISEDSSYDAANLTYTLTNFGILALSTLIVEGIFFLTIPLIDKKGRTIGMMLAKSMLISRKRESYASIPQKIGRFFYILIVNTLIPIAFITQWIAPVIIILSIVFIPSNTDNLSLHDLICGTRIIMIDTFKE